MFRWMALALGLVVLGTTPASATTAPIPIRVVVVTLFEVGTDNDGSPGELENWVKRFPLPEIVPFPQGYHHLRLNREKRVLAVLTGVGTARAAASLMALGMDPRFDLRRAYFVLAGISGGDPNDVSVGSAAWAEWLVDADLAHEIDAREIPDDWTTGYLPLFTSRPYERPKPAPDGEVYHLNAKLVEWAFQTTKDTALPDSEPLRRLRQNYTGYPNALKPPFVLKGDVIAGSTFWHGARLNRWANEWTRYWTNGQGNYATTAMEDTGVAQAIRFLGQAGKVDPRRLLVLRTVSNYAMQYPGITAAQSLAQESDGEFSAFLPSLNAAYAVGSAAVNAILADWATYRTKLPGS
ncbi:MAG: purine nucleoside permease [Geminicoccaceae bacterium]